MKGAKLLTLTTITVVAGLSVCEALAAGSEAKEDRVLSNDFIAFDSGLKRGQWSPEKQAKLTKKLGYDGIVYKHPHNMQARLEALDKYGVNFSGLHTSVNLDRDSIKYPELEQAMEKLEGCGTIVWPVVTGSKAGDKKAVRIFQRMGRKARENGLKVAIYPHANTYVETTPQALRIAKKVDMDSVGVSFNLCHSLRAAQAGDINQILHEAAPFLFLVQISGATRGGKKWAEASWNHLIRPLDDNEFDLVGYLGTLVEIGYDGPICLMPFGIDLPPKTHMSRSMRAYKKLRRKVRGAWGSIEGD